MSVARFVKRLGIPRATWYYWRAAAEQGRSVSRWPAPVVDEIAEAVARHKATEHGSAWGHRKIWDMLCRDGYRVSEASVKRALGRQGLLLPVRYQAERRALGQARKALFTEPPTRRNRVWQTDFSEFETSGGGDWQLSGVVDYVAKVCLACPATPTQTAKDAVAALKAAIAEAEELIAMSLAEDCVDPETGEICPLTIVTDNGPAYKSDDFARFIGARPWLRHVRTRYRSPQNNGVVERFNESAKYEHLFRRDIPNGIVLNDELEAYRQIYNRIRPHESLGQLTPMEIYLADPTKPWPTREQLRTR
jgi:transposase InsO family protein